MQAILIKSITYKKLSGRIYYTEIKPECGEGVSKADIF